MRATAQRLSLLVAWIVLTGLLAGAASADVQARTINGNSKPNVLVGGPDGDNIYDGGDGRDTIVLRGRADGVPDFFDCGPDHDEIFYEPAAWDEKDEMVGCEELDEYCPEACGRSAVKPSPAARLRS